MRAPSLCLFSRKRIPPDDVRPSAGNRADEAPPKSVRLFQRGRLAFSPVTTTLSFFRSFGHPGPLNSSSTTSWSRTSIPVGPSALNGKHSLRGATFDRSLTRELRLFLPSQVLTATRSSRDCNTSTFVYPSFQSEPIVCGGGQRLLQRRGEGT